MIFLKCVTFKVSKELFWETFEKYNVIFYPNANTKNFFEIVMVLLALFL